MRTIPSWHFGLLNLVKKNKKRKAGGTTTLQVIHKWGQNVENSNWQMP
jgi:hypothetical protein